MNLFNLEQILIFQGLMIQKKLIILQFDFILMLILILQGLLLLIELIIKLEFLLIRQKFIILQLELILKFMFNHLMQDFFQPLAIKLIIILYLKH